MTMKSEREGGEAGIRLPSLKLVGLLVAVAAAAIFFFQNGHDTAVEFLGFSATWPLRMVILISIALGVVIDRLGGWLWRRSRRRTG